MELIHGHLKAYKIIDLSIDKYLLHHIDHNVMLKENKATEYIEQYWYMNVTNRAPPLVATQKH